MNAIGRAFADFDSDFLLLSRSLQIVAENQVALYMFRATTSSQMSEVLKETMGWKGKTCAAFRARLQTNGAVNKNLKFYLYSRLSGYETSALLFGVSKDDRKLAGRLLSSSVHECVLLRKKIYRYGKQGFKPVSLEKFERAITNSYADLNEFCRKFAYRKLRFIMDSMSLEPEDLVHEFMEFGIYSVYRAYPEIQNGHTHLQNIAKRGIHNRGINIIKSATTLSRNPIRNDGGGKFTRVAVSMGAYSTEIPDHQQGSSEYMTICSNLIVGLDGSSAEGLRPEEASSTFELKQAVMKIEKRIGNPKYRRFYRLMQGQLDVEFSKWLGIDNDDLYEEVGRGEYLNRCIEYLGIPKVKAKRFLAKLRQSLNGFNPNMMVSEETLSKAKNIH